MPRSINFVTDRRKELSFTEQQDRQIFKKFAIAGGVVLFLLLAAVSTRFYFVWQLRSISQQQEEARQVILSLEKIERDYSIFATKLSQITELWGQRQNKQEAIAFFNNLFSGNSQRISGISYSRSVKALTFRLESNSIFTIEDAFEVLSSEQVVAEYPTIGKKQLSRAPDAGYAVEITVPLGSN